MSPSKDGNILQNRIEIKLSIRLKDEETSRTFKSSLDCKYTLLTFKITKKLIKNIYMKDIFLWNIQHKNKTITILASTTPKIFKVV